MNQKGNAVSLKPRKKGTKNKFTNLKQSFLDAFEQMGGTEALLEWGTRNKGKFYQMLAKILPNEIQGEFQNKEGITVIFETVQKSDEAKVSNDG